MSSQILGNIHPTPSASCVFFLGFHPEQLRWLGNSHSRAWCPGFAPCFCALTWKFELSSRAGESGVPAIAPLQDAERREVWEIFDDRYQARSTILTSQLPVARWHEQVGDPTLADGILDRLVHNAHRIEMRGESMRKKRNHPRDESDEKKE